jgi:hypothetical protein
LSTPASTTPRSRRSCDVATSGRSMQRATWSCRLSFGLQECWGGGTSLRLRPLGPGLPTWYLARSSRQLRRPRRLDLELHGPWART